MSRLRLGLRVTIKDRGKKGGDLILHYDDLDQLDDILVKLGARSVTEGLVLGRRLYGMPQLRIECCRFSRCFAGFNRGDFGASEIVES